jgi:putative intracellular protease/amidase
LKLKDVDLSGYDAIHIAGGRGATFDLFPSEDAAKALEYFWSRDKIVGAICHGAIALGNIPNRIRGRRVTGYTLGGDLQLQSMFGSGFLIPHFPQTVLEETGAFYARAGGANDPCVVIDGKLVTGQNQQSASEYACLAASDGRPNSGVGRSNCIATISRIDDGGQACCSTYL